MLKCPSGQICSGYDPVRSLSEINYTVLILLRSSLGNWQNPENGVSIPVHLHTEDVCKLGCSAIHVSSVFVCLLFCLHGQMRCAVPHLNRAPPLKTLTLPLPRLQEKYFHWVNLPASTPQQLMLLARSQYLSQQFSDDALKIHPLFHGISEKNTDNLIYCYCCYYYCLLCSECTICNFE